MQMAHPLIAAGVAHHSAFRGTALQAARRAHQTIGAMLSLVFGDDAERNETLDRIRAIHRKVNGTLTHAAGPFPAGTRYSAEDPALLLWVHATLADSTADIYGRLVRPLTEPELDTLCVEAIPTLVELGGDGATAPRTWRAMRAYIDEMLASGVLAVSAEGREIGEAVLSPRAAGLPVPFGGVHRLISIGLLPPSLREAYGFTWTATQQMRFDRAIRLLRRVRRVTPQPLALFAQARR
jgi:uncharacterized protein (DUF2236 family)